MQSNKIILTISFIFVALFSISQLKGKAKKLPGTWIYQQGSGYEVWEVKNGNLIGAGYRTNKLGDTVRVESLAINSVNNFLYYTLETGQYSFSRFRTTDKRQFVSKLRKLDFASTENKMPARMKYSFGFLNRNKMIISIYMNEDMKKTKLILHKGEIN